jgi:hypothetical protein
MKPETALPLSPEPHDSSSGSPHSVQNPILTFFFRCDYYFHVVPFIYRNADKSLARPTSRCILFDGENISFDASLIYIYIYIYINSTNIPPIMIVNRIHETQNVLLFDGENISFDASLVLYIRVYIYIYIYI